MPSGRSQRPGRVDVPEERVQQRGLARRLRSLGEVTAAGLAVTYVLDPTSWSGPASVALRFTGTREGGTGTAGDRFERVERIGEVVPGAGPVSVTARVGNVNHGTWHVVAVPEPGGTGRDLPTRRFVTETTMAQLAQGPGVRLEAWPLLVGAGAVVAVAVQALLLGGVGLPVAPLVGLSVLACLLGFPGGKLWYLAANRRPLREFLHAGAGIQGFLLTALAVVLVGSVALGLPAGTVLDATAPGIFLGVAVGRPGCFLTGCCAGRPTRSRWGMTSSDRRLLLRRVPVQLMEGTAGLAVGSAALAVFLTAPPPVPGALLAAAVAAYTLARQLLFPLRTNTHTRSGRRLVLTACVAVLAAVAVGYAVT